jgi:lipopolysaccharide export LptBFGC system permease protein LptF
MQRYINDIKNDYDNKFMETKNSFELDKMSLENQIKRLKDANIQQEHEYNILSAKYDSILGTLTFKDNQEERDVKIETLHNAKHISNNNLGISNTKATTTQMESDYKFWQIVAVGAVPLIALGVGMLAKKWLDK